MVKKRWFLLFLFCLALLKSLNVFIVSFVSTSLPPSEESDALHSIKLQMKLRFSTKLFLPMTYFKNVDLY